MTLGATAIGLFVLASPSFAHDQAEAQKAVDSFAANYAQLYNAKDATGIVALFATDGVEAVSGPILTSRDDIEKRFKTIFDAGFTDLHFDMKQVQAEGNIVFAVGEYTVKAKDGHMIGGNVTNIYSWDGDALKYRVHSYGAMMSPPPAK